MKYNAALILATSLILSYLSAGKAFTQTFKKGDNDLNFTLGLGSPWILSHSSYRATLPPVMISFDHGFRDDLGPGVIGIGALAGITSFRDRPDPILYPNTNWGWRATSLILAIRGTYHIEFLKKLDTYGGINIGARYESWVEFGDMPSIYRTNHRSRIMPVAGVYFGAKYLLTSNLFVLGEVGYNFGMISLGVGLKM